MTKLKNRIAGITAATMTAAALTATVAAPAMATTAPDCTRVVAASTDPSVEVVAPGLATITVRNLFRRGGSVARAYITVSVGTGSLEATYYGAGPKQHSPEVTLNALGDEACAPIVQLDGNAEEPRVTVLVSLPDSDGDGVLDADDRFPNSVMTPTVVLGDQDSGVLNTVAADGASLADLFAEAMDGDAKADKKATKALLKSLEDGDVISKDDRKALKSAVKDLLKAEKDAAKA